MAEENTGAEQWQQGAAGLVGTLALGPLGAPLGGLIMNNPVADGVKNMVSGVQADWEERDGLGKAEMVADTAMDAGGFIPVVGTFVDLAHAGKQLILGDFQGAALYAVAAIPVAGDIVAAGKVGVKGLKAASKGAEVASKSEHAITTAAKGAEKGAEAVADGAKLTEKGAEAAGKAEKGTFLDAAKGKFGELHKAVREEQAGWSKGARFFTTAPHENLARKIFGDFHTVKGTAKVLGTAGGLFAGTNVAFSTIASGVTKAFAAESDQSQFSDEGMQAYIERYKQTYKEQTGEEPTEIKMPDGSTYDTTTGNMYAEDGSLIESEQDGAQNDSAENTSSTSDTSSTSGNEVEGQNSLTAEGIGTDIAKQFGLDVTQPPVSSIVGVVNELGQWLSQAMKSVTSALGLDGAGNNTASNDLESILNSQYGDGSSYNETDVENAEVDDVTKISQEQRVHADTSTLDTSMTDSYDQQYY